MHAPRRAPRGPGGEDEAVATGPAVWPAPMLGPRVPSSPQATPNTVITDLTSARPVSALMLLRFRIKVDPGGRRHPVQYTGFS